MSGYTTGLSVVVFSSQVPSFLGYSVPTTSGVLSLYYVRHSTLTNLTIDWIHNWERATSTTFIQQILNLNVQHYYNIFSKISKFNAYSFSIGLVSVIALVLTFTVLQPRLEKFRWYPPLPFPTPLLLVRSMWPITNTLTHSNRTSS